MNYNNTALNFYASPTRTNIGRHHNRDREPRFTNWNSFNELCSRIGKINFNLEDTSVLSYIWINKCFHTVSAMLHSMRRVIYEIPDYLRISISLRNTGLLLTCTVSLWSYTYLPKPGLIDWYQFMYCNLDLKVYARIYSIRASPPVGTNVVLDLKIQSI